MILLFEFIFVVEEIGFIIKIGEMVIEKVFLDFKEWEKKGIDYLYMVINFLVW